MVNSEMTENPMHQAAQQARQEERDPSRMLRVLALLSAPVFDPADPDRPPALLDLHQEWHVLAEGVRQSKAPILLARLRPPTLDSLRSALSPRTSSQEVFPQILHFSGHAWREGLLRVMEPLLYCTTILPVESSMGYSRLVSSPAGLFCTLAILALPSRVENLS